MEHTISVVKILNFGKAELKRTGKGKVKVIPQQAEVTQGFRSRLRPRILLTFGTTRVLSRQPYALAAFTPG